MAKFDKKLFNQNIFFAMKLLHIHAQYTCIYIIYIVTAKYQKASVKAQVQTDFPVYALSKQKQNKHYLSESKTSKRETMAKFTKLSFCPKNFFLA